MAAGDSAWKILRPMSTPAAPSCTALEAIWSASSSGSFLPPAMTIGTGQEAVALGVIEVVWTENASAHGYGYENKEHCEEKMIYRLAEDRAAKDAADVAVAAWRALRCRDGGRVDIRFGDDGKAYFLEVNPLAGLNPDRSDLVFIARFKGLSYRDLIERILESFVRRRGAD